MSKTLIEAAKKGNLEELNQLLQEPNLNINTCDEDGCTALYSAARQGHTPIVQALITAKAEVNVANKKGYTALHVAAYQGHTPIVQALIIAKADVNLADRGGFTALHWAAHQGHTRIVQALIIAKTDVNVAEANGYTALHWAAQEGHTRTVQALITAKADVNVVDPNHSTALCLAAREGRTSIVQALIIAKADVNVANKYGLTALYLAALYQGKNPNQVLQTGIIIIEALLNAGAFIDISVEYFPENDLVLNVLTLYKTAIEQLFIAASNLKTTQEDIDSILSKLGAGLNGRLQNNNNTALHVAIEKNLKLALKLIAKGASVDVLGNNRLSVRDILNQLYAKNPSPMIKLCLAYVKLHDLRKKVHHYIQETKDIATVTIELTAHSAIAPIDSKSAMDNTPSLHSMIATAAAGTAVPATVTGGATTSVGASSSSFETVKSNSELELQLSEVYSLIMKDTSKSLEDDNVNFDLKESQESDAMEGYLEFKKQSFYFELGEFIFHHPALFPNALGIVERLLENIKQNHPHFQMANVRLVELGMQVMKQPSAQNNTATIKRIKRLLYAGKASPHYDTVGDLMADVLGHGLENQALRGFKANHADLVFTLFNSLNDQYTLGKAAQKNTQEALAREKNALAREQKALAEKQDALVGEQKAMDEITKLRLLLSSNGANSKTDADRATKDSNLSPVMLLRGAKIQGQDDGSSTAPLSAAAALETAHSVPPNSASSTTATSVTIEFNRLQK